MGQRYSDRELAQSKARDERDDHAHARIDELHQALIELFDVQSALHVRGRLAEADKRAEKRVGLR